MDSAHRQDRLQKLGSRLPSEVRDALLADRHGLVAELSEVLAHGRFHRTSSESDGWAPFHAVELLAEIGTPEAVQALVNAYLQQIAPEGPLRQRIVSKLSDVGPPVLEPVLAAFGRSRDLVDRRGLCEILAHIGVRDERVFDALREVFDADRVFGGIALLKYDEQRALPLVAHAAKHPSVSADDRYQLGLLLLVFGPKR